MGKFRSLGKGRDCGAGSQEMVGGGNLEGWN